jgi:hypothetical protein
MEQLLQTLLSLTQRGRKFNNTETQEQKSQPVLILIRQAKGESFMII